MRTTYRNERTDSGDFFLGRRVRHSCGTVVRSIRPVGIIVSIRQHGIVDRINGFERVKNGRPSTRGRGTLDLFHALNEKQKPGLTYPLVRWQLRENLNTALPRHSHISSRLLVVELRA